jgi:hypothetical protein
MVKGRTGDLADAGLLASEVPKCGQCRKPMRLELAEPVVGISGAVVLTFKCPICGLAEKIKRAHKAIHVPD